MPAPECEHPEDELEYTGSSSEDAAVGSRWPVKVNWFQCRLCGAELHTKGDRGKSEP